MAFWSGILNADGELRTYRYKVPETFSGEIKVMAVAVTAGRFGSAQNRALVRGDFALTPSWNRLTFPRAMSLTSA